MEHYDGSFLRKDLPPYARIQAYADDISVSIVGRSRAQLKIRASEILDIVSDWGNSRSLTFSTKKSTAIPLRGNLSSGYTVLMGTDRIRVVEAARFLGVWLDRNLTFRSHVQQLKLKNLGVFSRLRGAIGKDWGYSRENAILLYNAVFLPKVTYAARMWSSVTGHGKSRRTLEILQRTPLLGITSAYNTTSTHALQVISGKMPLHLEIKLCAAKSASRHLPAIEARELIHRAKEEVLDEWQTQWDSSDKGRWTYGFFPSIRTRLSIPLYCDQILIQLLTGHPGKSL